MLAKTKDGFSVADDELVVASLLGDLEAFDELVRRYRSAVVAVAQQMTGSRDVAEEVAQESFLIAFKELPQLSEISRFAGWLCAIVRHRARRVAAREGRSEPQEPSALDLIVLASSAQLWVHPEDEVTRKAEQSHIAQTLSHLAPEYQIVLRLRYYEEWPVQRMANFLSLPVTTVKWRLHHGRVLMRRELSKRTQGESDERNDTRNNRRNTRAGTAGHKRHAAAARSSAANRAVGARSEPVGMS